MCVIEHMQDGGTRTGLYAGGLADNPAIGIGVVWCRRIIWIIHSAPYFYVKQRIHGSVTPLRVSASRL